MALRYDLLSQKALCFVILVFGSTSFAFGQTTFFEVPSTPYDRQMSRIQETFIAPSAFAIEGLSFTLVNEWMIELRAMPYRYSREWRTPTEVEAAKAADCKEKRSRSTTDAIERREQSAPGDWQTARERFAHARGSSDTEMERFSDCRQFRRRIQFRKAKLYSGRNVRISVIDLLRTVIHRSPAAPAHGMRERIVRAPFANHQAQIARAFNCMRS